MNIFRKKIKTATDNKVSDNLPRPFYNEDDFSIIYYTLKNKINEKFEQKTHYLDEYILNDEKFADRISISEYDFLSKFYFSNIRTFFSTIINHSDFSTLLEYSCIHSTADEIIKNIKNSLFKNYLFRLDELDGQIKSVSYNSSFINTFSPFKSKEFLNIFLANQVLENFRIETIENSNLVFGIQDNLNNILISYFNEHIKIVRLNHEAFDFSLTQLEINRLMTYPESSIPTQIITNLEKLVSNLKDINPQRKEEEEKPKLTTDQSKSLQKILSSWFLDMDSHKTENLLDLILKQNEKSDKQYFFTVRLKEFSNLMTFLINKGFTSKEHIENLIDQKLILHHEYKFSRKTFQDYNSTFDFEKSLKMHHKNSKSKIYYNNFTELFN